MTTEILRNHLAAKEVEKGISLIEDLKMEDVDFIVLDEVHYMNDVDRGSVWEDVIVRSPNHLSLIMLSATID